MPLHLIATEWYSEKKNELNQTKFMCGIIQNARVHYERKSFYLFCFVCISLSWVKTHLKLCIWRWLSDGGASAKIETTQTIESARWKFIRFKSIARNKLFCDKSYIIWSGLKLTSNYSRKWFTFFSKKKPFCGNFLYELVEKFKRFILFTVTNFLYFLFDGTKKKNPNNRNC